MSNGTLKWATAVCVMIVGTAAIPAQGEDTADAKMAMIATGAMRKMGGYRPQQLKMSAEKPADLKKAPEMAAPMYGSIEFGGKSYLMAIDEPDGKDAKLYVDANGNGDLTDDPAAEWKVREMAMPNGQKMKQFSGSFKLPLTVGDKPEMVNLGAYRFDKNDPQRAMLKDTFLYYSDYAYEGDVTLNGKKYHAMLTDDMASGDFRGPQAGAAKAAAAGPGGSGIRLLIDVNGDGQFDSRGEMFDASKPFNIKGTSWKVSEMTAGGSFKIAKSDEAVAEVMPPPDHSVGKKITPFKATRTDGTAVNFPADYKGKVVMLDFWATWCGPCMGEVPGLVKEYEASHPKGFEILGISLDQPNAGDKVKSVTAEKGMTWPQVYDGKFWKAEIADLYGIHSIPSAYLVDGDTGEVLANGDSLRGDQLAATVKTALEKKGTAAK
jgi:thiol-disulfide isomerase/thioredoxin